jgi:hypothetical protein
MGKFGESDARRAGRGVYVEPELIRKTHGFSVDAFMPKPDANVPGWQARVLGVARRVARVGAGAIDLVER